MKKPSALAPEQRLLRRILLALTLLTLLNLLLTGSIAGLIGGILILVMVWGIRRGDYPLTRGLSIFLFLYAALNFAVLVLTLVSGVQARVSALIWLGLYSAALVVLGLLLRNKALQSYLKTAPQPEEKEKKIHFFHGGWRDL